jgi:putative spermidine/putrescine transport system permease protein
MLILRIVGVLLGAFILLPLVVVVASAFTSAGFVSFPPQGFSLKWFVEAADTPNFRSGLVLSTVLAVVASAISTASGMLIGRLVTKSRSALARRIVQIFTLPLLVPTLIFAVASLQFWTFFGIRLSVGALVLGHIIVTLPFAVRTLVVAYQSIDPRLEEAAASLGASQFTIFRKIVLRGVAPGIISSVAFTALLSFDDVVVSLFLSPPGGQPLPVVMFSYLDQNVSPALSAVSVVIMAISLALVVLLERTVGLGSLFGVNQARR